MTELTRPFHGDEDLRHAPSGACIAQIAIIPRQVRNAFRPQTVKKMKFPRLP